MTRSFRPILAAALVLAACSDDEINRPYLDLHAASQVPLDPDVGRIERRQLVASVGPVVPVPSPVPAQLAQGGNALPSESRTGAPAPLAPLQAVTIATSAAGRSTATSDAPPTQPWTTTPGLSLRAQIRRWVGDSQGAAADQYYLVDRDPDDPPEPIWEITEADQYTGDILGALAWLRDGFADAPRPDIVVTANRRILIHALGAAQ